MVGLEKGVESRVHGSLMSQTKSGREGQGEDFALGWRASAWSGLSLEREWTGSVSGKTVAVVCLSMDKVVA